MSKAKGKGRGVDPDLVKAIAGLMKEVMEKPDEGKDAKFSLTDKMKVMDRFIKIEALRLDVQEDDSGSFFKQRGGAGNADE